LRRDCPPVAAECGRATLMACLKTPRDAEALLAPLAKALAELEDPQIPLARLEKTVAKKAFYKNDGDRLIQKRLFDKIRERTGREVDTGSRVGFIVTLPRDGRTRVRGKEDKLYLDGEETAHCADSGIEPDREYYVTKQILEPLTRYLKHTGLEPRIRGMVQRTLDKIWVQNTRTHTLFDLLARAPATPRPQPPPHAPLP
jgi:DNA polymerase elongation subunit (family B)